MATEKKVVDNSRGKNDSTKNFNFADDLDLSRFAGTPYEAQAKALAETNYQYKMGAFENLAQSLGWRTSYDQYKENLRTDVMNKYNDLLGKLGDIQQNSPASKASQMLQAGQNPDLLGTEGVSDAPGLPSDPVQAQSPQPGSSRVPDLIYQAFTGALDMFSKIQGIKGVMESNRMVQTERRAKLRQEFFDTILDRFPIDESPDFESSKWTVAGASGLAFDPKFKDERKKQELLPFLGLSRVQGKPYWQILRKYHFDNSISASDARYLAELATNTNYRSSRFQTELQSRRTKYYQDRVDEIKARSDGHFDDVREVSETLAKTLSKYNSDTLTLEANSKRYHTANELAKGVGLLGEQTNPMNFNAKETQGFNEGRSRNSADYLRYMSTKQIKSAMDAIDELVDEGNEFAPYFLLLLNVLAVSKIGI